jgi:integrase
MEGALRFSVKNTDALKLPRGKSDHIVWDDELGGFGIRLREGGSRHWVFQYKIGSKQRRMTFGKYPALDAKKARERAEQLHAKVRLGEDPAGAKHDARARAQETFEACAQKYLAWQRKEVRPSTYSENERHLLKNLSPLHGLHIDKIDKRTIAAQLTRFATDGGPVQANRTRASLSKFLNWCLREGLVESNQAVLTNVNKERKSDRVLVDAELKQIWKALPENDYSAIVRLLILTGQRRDEIADLHWSEIDFDRGIITLPPHRTKNGREHVIPMSAMVTSILEGQIRREGRDLVFGNGHGGFSGFSKAKHALDDAIASQAGKNAKPMLPWIIHDLRRSVATGMAEIGIQPHIIEAILNHISGHKSGVAGIYNRAAYEAEKATALNRWAEHIAAIVDSSASNIAPFKRA